MPLGSERTASRRDTLLFLGCLALSIAARSVPQAFADQIAVGFRDTLLKPFLALQNQSEMIKSSQTRYSAVVAERDSFAMAADSVVPLRMENEQLRAVLGLRAKLPVTHITAEVLRQASPMNDFSVVLSTGRNQGVRPMAPVLSP
jgi:cell shape-determining protein MreC